MAKRSESAQNGDLEGRFLVAMPGMLTSVFADSVVYVCAHGVDGAMGFLINKPAPMTLSELVGHAGIDTEIMLTRQAVDASAGPVRIGGPVDEHRGFVLHSADYVIDATIPISDRIYLTSTLEILRSIVEGHGPRQTAIALGYSGWGAGQLEREIRENAWLPVDADPALVFDHDNDGKYEALIAGLGIGAANLIREGGNA
ncbi:MULTISPECIES: YqgE/AlgH family protein [unclassified Roseitalea]|uniref:YqgE/AlgH family protein n=1 Tax=unclassified Roseitalea TaxID=2639107 RepID=UPI00273DC5C8|nr:MULTISPECIES: YqgE/AlgH family protein [unclassified Roseitalea]